MQKEYRTISEVVGALMLVNQEMCSHIKIMVKLRYYKKFVLI